MSYEVIGSDWYTPMQPAGQVGVVAISSGPAKDNWKAYIGVILNGGTTEEIDQQFIAANGAKLPKNIACAYFPDLDPERFIY